MKHIDADKLIAEIKHRIRLNKEMLEIDSRPSDWGRIQEGSYILRFIERIQQEQPEVDLDFQVFAKEMDVVFNLPKEVTENTEENPLNWEYAIALHFYELGLNTRKEETK